MSISKVAKLAKVSSATVSRVINGSASVKPETIVLVKKAMAKAGYSPKPLSSRPGPRPKGTVGLDGYKRKRTGVIALVMCMKPSYLGVSPTMASIVNGIEGALTQKGLSMVQVYVQPGGPIPPILSKNGIDGSLVIHEMPESVEAVLERHPRVTLMSETVSRNDHVFCDNRAIGNLAFEYLRDRGHQHLAFLTLHKDHAASITRKEAFIRAAQKLHIKVDVYEHENKWGYDLLTKPKVKESMCMATVEQILKSSERPTGMFVVNDAATAILYPVLKNARIEPGKDIDIISCNNEEMLLAGLFPRPATIDIMSEYVGQRAVELLCSRIQNPDGRDIIEVKIQPELVIPS